MTLLSQFSLFALSASLTIIILVFTGSYFLVFCQFLFSGRKEVNRVPGHHSVSMIIVVRNAEELIADKIVNALSLQYPSDDFEIIVYSDGSTDDTEIKVRSVSNQKVCFFSSPNHAGKNAAMNNAVDKATGEVLVFSDVDALLETDAVVRLIEYLNDSAVGGVCGQRVIRDQSGKQDKHQGIYIGFDSSIKIFESRVGSISANDGKLYCMRKKLFQPVPDAVTDDLYNCLTVVSQQYRFLFNPEALAYIRMPSRNAGHEIERRQRIVSRSLYGIFHHREVLNPLRYGTFALKLFINKILRRIMPFCLPVILVSSLILAVRGGLFSSALVGLQILFYSLAFMYPFWLQNSSGWKLVRKIASLAFYFCVGNYGTLLGVLSFLSGKRAVKWEPKKKD